jgi:hypothetical protein
MCTEFGYILYFTSLTSCLQARFRDISWNLWRHAMSSGTVGTNMEHRVDQYLQIWTSSVSQLSPHALRYVDNQVFLHL